MYEQGDPINWLVYISLRSIDVCINNNTNVVDNAQRSKVHATRLTVHTAIKSHMQMTIYSTKIKQYCMLEY